MKHFIASVVIVAACSQLGNGSCESGNPDPGLDVWCNETLCYWKVETGDVRKAATWHSADLGAELVGERASISQLEDDSPQCLQISLIANVERDASLQIEVDEKDDGVDVRTITVPTAPWQDLTYSLRLSHRAPFEPRSARYRIIKTGRGVAVIAQMDIKAGLNCPASNP
jgi:hypothetical protein